MKRLILMLGVAVASVVLAQEAQLGIIVVSDGGTGSNINTGYTSGLCAADRSCDQAFEIPNNQPITIVCPQYPAVVAIGRATNDAGIGVDLGVGEKFFTLSGPKVSPITRPDGGSSTTSSVVSIAPIPGNSTAICKVQIRKGVE